MDTRFTGVIPPVITPFRDGRVDLDSLDRLIDLLIGAGVDGLFIDQPDIAVRVRAQRAAP